MLQNLGNNKDATRHAWLVFSRLPETGPATLLKLRAQFGSVLTALEANDAALMACLTPAAISTLSAYRKHPAASPLTARIQRDIEWLSDPNQTLLTIDDADYPPLLREIAVPPPLLYVMGDTGYLHQRQLGVVGSRNASSAALDITRELVSDITGAGLVITSGLALGIDAAAHTAALDADGTTIAVLGSGLDHIYPLRHRGLAERIAASGAVVSEFPLGTAPSAENFPRRNRLISGMSLGVLVVEAALKSGSLITARYALEHNREVFAVPGSVRNPNARGCHQLLRQGAVLVESAADVLSELGFLFAHQTPRASVLATSSITPEEARLIEAADYDAPASAEALANSSGMPLPTALGLLVEMEIRGYLRKVEMGYVRSN